MNKYGRLAMSHWQKIDPDRYRQIPDPETFFTELGERAEIEIQQLQDAIAGRDRPAESYLEKVGRLNMARLSAEEQVLAETVLIPGPQAQQDDEEEESEGYRQAARHLELMRELARLRQEEE
jgi:hypothetical protein